MRIKTLLLINLVFVCLHTYGDTKTTNLNPINIGQISPKGSRSSIPVDYDENNVIIRSDSTIYCADIVIKNQNGEVMNRQQLDILPKADNVISAPDSPDSEKQTIEIIVDKQRYLGYFE